MRRLILGVGCVALANWVALAGPFDATCVSADAQWIVHANLSKLNDTGMGDLLFAEFATENTGQKLDDFRQEYGFDPRTDLRSVTIYGNGWDAEKAVALFRGSFSRERLAALARTGASHTETVYKGHTIHGWNGVNRGYRESAYGSITADDTVVISRSSAMVKLALDVLDGRSDSFVSTSSGDFGRQLLLPVTGSPPLLVGAANLKGAAQACPKASVLRNAREGWFSVFGDGSNVKADLSLTAKDESTAANIQGVIQGLISSMALTARPPPEPAELAQIIQVSLEGLSVKIRLNCPMLPMLRFLKERIAEANKGPG